MISKNLTGEYKEFWDTLYNFDKGVDIYNSLLFRQDVCIRKNVISNNPYLQDNNYEKLKNILKTETIKINPITTDILDTRFDKKYDLINLSNILSYYLPKEEYVKYFESNFSLTEKAE